MKKTSYLWSSLAILLVMALSFSFVACGDDDDKKDSSTAFGLVDNDQTADILYEEPYIQWGATKSMVKNDRSNKSYAVEEEDSEYIIYKGKYKESLTGYFFNDSKLTQVGVRIDESVAGLDVLQNHVTNLGYQYLTTENDGYYYMSSDQRTVVLIQKDGDHNYYYVWYFDYAWLTGEGDGGGGQSGTTLYAEPYIQWGATKTKVKNAMSSYELLQEDTDRLYYDGKYKEYYSGYFFENNKLTDNLVVFEQSATTLTELKNHVTSKGYQYVTTGDGGTLYYLSSDQVTLVIIETSSEYAQYFVRYVDYEWLMSDTPDSNIIYEEPYTVWGAARTTVKTAMSNRGYVLQNESNSADDGYYLVYAAKYQEDFSMYFFDSSKKFEEVGFCITLTLNEVRNYINSIASYATVNEGKYYYITSDGKSVICAYQAESGSVYVFYWEYNSSSRSMMNDGSMNKMVNERTALFDKMIAQSRGQYAGSISKNTSSMLAQVAKQSTAQKLFPKVSREAIRADLQK